MWFRTKASVKAPNKDVREAQSLRDEAKADMQEVQRKDPYITGLATRLIERRDRNGFGEQIQITYTRRNA